jgi:TPR repeat protein
VTRIAISYRRDDSAGITGRIFDRLVAHYGGDSVFRDVDNIPLGVDFRDHINSVLAQTDITLVVVGKRWVGPLPRRGRRIDDPADPVRVEVETALRNGMPVVPVLVEGGAMPTVDQLPDSLREFVYRNGLEVDSGRDFDQHIERLIRSMEPILARRANALAEVARRAEEDKRQAEAARQAEEEERQAEAARQAEEKKRQAETARQAEEGKRRAEAVRRAEEEKRWAEAARQAEEKKQRAEAARLAEEEKRRAEAARQAEEENRRAELARQAERAEREQDPAAQWAGEEQRRAKVGRQAEKYTLRRGRSSAHLRRLAIAGCILIAMTVTVAGGAYLLYTEKQHTDGAPKAIEEKQRADAAQKAAEEKQRADAAQKAAEEKQRADAAQKDAEEKQRADAAQKDAEGKQRADAAQKAAEEKQRADAAQKAMMVPPGPESSSAVSAGVAAYDRKDYSTALWTLQPAAQAGDKLAQYYLGVMYLNGYGVPKKPDLALEWLSKAASAGLRDAQSYMGAFHRRGDLVPQNYEEAMRWYLLAAKQDYENSQYNIALMYYKGEGVKTDPRKAYMWAVIASMGGEPEPNRLRMKLEQTLSASDIAEGQREAAHWRAENIIPK